MWRFSAAIAVYADANSLVANNLLSSAQRNATVRKCGVCLFAPSLESSGPLAPFPKQCIPCHCPKWSLLSLQVTVSFKGDNVTSRNLPFPYDSRYGIDTKQLLGGVAGHVSGPGGPCAPGLGTLTPQVSTSVASDAASFRAQSPALPRSARRGRIPST